jgi:hypothetical protein
MKLDRLLILPYSSCSNYVNLPSNILDKLSKNTKNNDKHYFFELKTSYGLSFYVGVKQFTATEGTIEVPEWIVDNIGEDYIEVHLLKNVAKGKFVKIQPQEKKFFSLPDNDVILEKALSEYCLLHINDTIKVKLLDEEYSMKIVEIKTENNKNAKTINIVNTDLNVDFENIFPEEKIIEPIQPVNNIIFPNTTFNEPIQPVNKEEPPVQPPITYNAEEIRQKRLAYYQNKFQSHNKPIEPIVEETKKNNISSTKEMEI